MPKKPFYITTTLPYVNADPHIGFAMELIRADVIARVKKLTGFDVFFNTGTDEHGMKVYRKAKEEGIDPKAYVDRLSENYRKLHMSLGVLPDINFIRTTDKHHMAAAQEFWKIADKNGYIYKKDYSVKYCVGCELEKTDSELVNGRCPLHLTQELEIIKEENYFFRFSAFQKKLSDLYEKNPSFVIPDFRFNEAKSLVKGGLEDFSISRLVSKMSWGIPVPGDPTQVMYVWFDALVDYISAIGWPDDPEKFEKWWLQSGGVVQYCGKDQIRQQAAMWQAMLMAAGLPPSKTIVVDGFIIGDGGIKMSKSLGNTVDPFEVLGEYGTDALRYYLVREVSSFEDSPFTMEKFKEAYNAGLANGIGNLTSRILKLTSDYAIKTAFLSKEEIWKQDATKAFIKALDVFDIQEASNEIWGKIAALDKTIQETQPFKLLKSENEHERNQGIETMVSICKDLWWIAVLLEPIMPQTALAIQELVQANKMPAAPLFMRK